MKICAVTCAMLLLGISHPLKFLKKSLGEFLAPYNFQGDGRGMEGGWKGDEVGMEAQKNHLTNF